MPNQPKTPIRRVRVPDEIWQAAQARARDEQTNVSAVINAFLRAWIGRTGHEIGARATPTPVRGVRVPDEIWQAAQARAREEQANVSAVINAFLRVWADRTEPETPADDGSDHEGRDDDR
ncbi:MAG: hypothetical protein GEV03_07065 [Streptosporangiales bacterium]|nr:hypothetical protein [Streptosporangiales bacterium]